jgi:hypothetical protein
VYRNYYIQRKTKNCHVDKKEKEKEKEEEEK